MVFSSKTSRTDDLVQLARLGLSGKAEEVESYVRGIIHRAKDDDIHLARRLTDLLSSLPPSAASKPRRGNAVAISGRDSQYQLAKYEYPVNLTRQPILNEGIVNMLKQVINERAQAKEFEREGLLPTRSLLFTGPSGVGKTLTARLLAVQLGYPLVTLDLAAVLGGFLGQTGYDLRFTLEYARKNSCMLHLDEFDAVVERGNDEAELIELKRLVALVIREVGDWPHDCLLVATTSHKDLLGDELLAKFDMKMEFSLPTLQMLYRAIAEDFGPDWDKVGDFSYVLGRVWAGRSFADVAKAIAQIRRQASTGKGKVAEITGLLLREEIKNMPREEKEKIAAALKKSGWEDYKIRRLTDVTRDELRRLMRK